MRPNILAIGLISLMLAIPSAIGNDVIGGLQGYSSPEGYADGGVYQSEYEGYDWYCLDSELWAYASLWDGEGGYARSGFNTEGQTIPYTQSVQLGDDDQWYLIDTYFNGGVEAEVEKFNGYDSGYADAYSSIGSWVYIDNWNPCPEEEEDEGEDSEVKVPVAANVLDDGTRDVVLNDKLAAEEVKNIDECCEPLNQIYGDAWIYSSAYGNAYGTYHAAAEGFAGFDVSALGTYLCPEGNTIVKRVYGQADGSTSVDAEVMPCEDKPCKEYPLASYVSGYSSISADAAVDNDESYIWNDLYTDVYAYRYWGDPMYNGVSEINAMASGEALSGGWDASTPVNTKIERGFGTENVIGRAAGDLQSIAQVYKTGDYAYSGADIGSWAYHNDFKNWDFGLVEAENWAGTYAYGSRDVTGADSERLTAEGWIRNGATSSSAQENQFRKASAKTGVELMGSGAHLKYPWDVYSQAYTSVDAEQGSLFGLEWYDIDTYNNLYTHGPGISGTILDDAGSLANEVDIEGTAKATKTYSTTIADKEMINWVVGNDPTFPGSWTISSPDFVTPMPGGHMTSGPTQDFWWDWGDGSRYNEIEYETENGAIIW